MTGIASTDTAAERLNRILYGRELNRLYTQHALEPASELAIRLDAAEAGIVVAATRDMFLTAATNVTVTVAPPIGRTPGQLAQLARLRLDWLAHLAIGMTMAAQLGARCLVYLPIDEQLSAATVAGRAAWQHLGDQLDQLTGYMAKDLAYPPDITVVHSDAHDVRKHLDGAAARHAGWLTDATVASINRTRAAHLPTTGISKHRLIANRDAILRHLPEVLTKVTGHATEHIIAIDTLSGAPAASLARLIAATDLHQRVDLLACVAAPNLTGTAAMTNAAATAVLTLGEDPATTRTKLRQLNGHQRIIWLAMWQLHNQALAVPADPGLTAMIAYYRHLYEQVRTG